MVESLLAPLADSSPEEEPILAIDDIQGNVLRGFNKEHETLLFLEIQDSAAFRGFLRDIEDRVTTTRQVLEFRQQRRDASRAEANVPTSVWLQVAFTHRGLARLVSPDDLAKFRDPSFVAGLAARSVELGDPPGSAEGWVIGREEDPMHVLLLVAGDDRESLDAEVRHLAKLASDGARVLHESRGQRLPNRAEEHFGFRDGISQPGVRGRLSAQPDDWLTPRRNPDNANEGMPGQQLIWPGEFVFGYRGQDSNARAAEGGFNKKGPCSLGVGEHATAPAWAANGSYLVFRRLNQDVGAFRSSVRCQAAALGISEDLLEAKIVGRFRSGVPVARTELDDPRFAGDEANNDFTFAADSPQIEQRAYVGQVERVSPPALADFDGERCPFAAHIRKVYPRADTTRFEILGADQIDTEAHRILRRAIPFGPPYPEETPDAAVAGAERGLLFIAYQTSIVDQFEHIHIKWANFTEQRGARAGQEFSAGVDPLIGVAPGGVHRFLIKLPGRPDASGSIERTLQAKPWVTPTGGGYFFVPSVSALAGMARGEV